MSIANVLSGTCHWTVQEGDCIDVLRTMPDACIDALVTDPPSGISFMNKKWDSDHGGRDKWVARMTERFAEAYRVMKPGAHGLVWALPRTSHWTAYALEDAGFEIRDKEFHIFGSGFPKSLNIGKAIDKLAGAERDVIGTRKLGGNAAQTTKEKGGTYASGTDSIGVPAIDVPITAPKTEDAKQWDGWGTALKPAVEEWVLIRKPFKGSVTKNVLEHGTGAINIDGCRVDGPPRDPAFVNPSKRNDDWGMQRPALVGAEIPTGRWPSHLLLSHAEGCERVGDKKVKAAPPWNDNRSPSLFTGEETSPVHHADEDGMETVEDWQCVEGCPVRLLNEQSGDCPSGSGNKNERTCTAWEGGAFKPMNGSSAGGDEGGASRYFTTFPPFFYTAKADRADREKGCEHLPVKTGGEATGRTDGTDGLKSPRAGAGRKGGRRNTHPTVKSTDLMRWLVRLITPPGGVVLDMFTGSGSTGVGCSAEGFRFIGIELEPHSVEIAKARIVGDLPLFNTQDLREETSIEEEMGGAL